MSISPLIWSKYDIAVPSPYVSYILIYVRSI